MGQAGRFLGHFHIGRRHNLGPDGAVRDRPTCVSPVSPQPVGVCNRFLPHNRSADSELPQLVICLREKGSGGISSVAIWLNWEPARTSVSRRSSSTREGGGTSHWTSTSVSG